MPALVCLGAHSSCVHCRGTEGSQMSWPRGEEASPAPVPRAFPFDPRRHCPVVPPVRSQQSCPSPGKAVSSSGEQERRMRQILSRRESSKMCHFKNGS